MDLYSLYNEPKKLIGYEARKQLIPIFAWFHYEDFPSELRRREHLWADDPRLAYNYARYVIHGRWPPGEPALARKRWHALHYAVDVTKERFPEAEPLIARDPTSAVVYAREIIKGPWPLGEPAIARSGTASFGYANDVLQKPWPPGEPAIARSGFYAAEYMKRFTTRRPEILRLQREQQR